jgi:hypothetical protein
VLLGDWGRRGLLVRLSNKSQVRNLYVCTIGKGLELGCYYGFCEDISMDISSPSCT